MQEENAQADVPHDPTRDLKHDLQWAVGEITALRGTLEILQIKADAYEAMRQVIAMSSPRAGRGYSEDIVHRLRQRINTLSPDKTSEG